MKRSEQENLGKRIRKEQEKRKIIGCCAAAQVPVRCEGVRELKFWLNVFMEIYRLRSIETNYSNYCMK